MTYIIKNHSKELKNEARLGLLRGVLQLATAVEVTLGPKGRNVIIERPNEEYPHVTKDGVTVAESIVLENPLENMGAKHLQSVASKSNKSAGDGTTTATILAKEIMLKGTNAVELGSDPVEMKKGIDFATELIVKDLEEQAIKISYDSPEVEQIATVSANNDEVVGKIIAEAFKCVGEDGAVSIEESSDFETRIRKVDGLQFDRGLISTYFSSDPTSLQCSIRNPLIIVLDGKLTSKEDAIRLIEMAVANEKGLVVIAEDVVGEALSTLTLNKLKGGLEISAVKAPGFGDYRKDLIKDIAAIVGGKVVPVNRIQDIEEVYVDELFGTAGMVKMEAMSTLIMEGDRDEDALQKQIKAIDEKLKTNISEYEKEKLAQRKAKLGGGVAVIEVGAKSEVDMKELKDRYDDAKEAVISALEEGVVIGGGCALLTARNIAEASELPNNATKDFEVGVDILFEAIEAPFRAICRNAGVSPDVKLQGIDPFNNIGYNAKTDEYVDMEDEGILDPKKVTRVALEGASSVAGTLLTTECALVQTKM